MRSDVYHLNRFIIYWSASWGTAEARLWAMPEQGSSEVMEIGGTMVGEFGDAEGRPIWGPILRPNWFHWQGLASIFDVGLILVLIQSSIARGNGNKYSGMLHFTLPPLSHGPNRKIIISIGSIAVLLPSRDGMEWHDTRLEGMWHPHSVSAGSLWRPVLQLQPTFPVLEWSTTIIDRSWTWSRVEDGGECKEECKGSAHTFKWRQVGRWCLGVGGD